MRTIRFELPFAYALPNRTLRQHWRAATKDKRTMQRAVMAATAGQTLTEPMQRAHILIERHGVRAPDPDNLVGGAKRLIDCLTTPRLLNVRKPGTRQRVKNKRGMGFVVDDGSEHVTLEVKHVPARLCAQKTVVTITEILP
ncbi:hypothetical protein [Acetobacter cerevisiae]|uniref:Uncharacterized protein n=1 Tax=Acetobacter cerevisiae TaxID=178900 RepID=A0A149Q7M9_9PROT|nr:hypothetical protein [Acetobacter cerevisiae]KXU93320.1 hypothetical protein AD928_09100 [Acetobacter cerevisiae]GBQ10393.1 hypothetical protein AA14362_2537 [Acetobacter cerevisiae DSM 14362]